MVCQTHDQPPTDPAHPDPDPTGQRHTMWTWDVHTDTDNVGILVYPCQCKTWIIWCQLCAQVATARTRRPALSIAAAHGSTAHIDGCGTPACPVCEASWARAAASIQLPEP